MGEQKEFELEFDQETTKFIKEYADLSGKTEEQVVSYILVEFLEKQVPNIEKKAEEMGMPVSELMNIQFVRLLRALLAQQKSATYKDN